MPTLTSYAAKGNCEGLAIQAILSCLPLQSVLRSSKCFVHIGAVKPEKFCASLIFAFPNYLKRRVLTENCYVLFCRTL